LNSQAKWLRIEYLESLIVSICHPHELAIEADSRVKLQLQVLLTASRQACPETDQRGGFANLNPETSQLFAILTNRRRSSRWKTFGR
jgi:tagatose-1,6-bisphosphate aldolase non-catalytic subunit AgaZ/GatZ